MTLFIRAHIQHGSHLSMHHTLLVFTKNYLVAPCEGAARHLPERIIMTYEEFKNMVTERLMDYMPSDMRESHHIEVREVQKVNRVLDGFCVVPNEMPNISPTMYLNPLYDTFHGDFESFMTDLASSYLEHMKNTPSIDIGVINEVFSNLSNICLKLINKERNKNFLEGVPHRDFCNLTVVYYKKLDECLSILITNDIKAKMGVTEQQLWEIAYKNTPSLVGIETHNIVELMKHIMEKEGFFTEIPEDLLEIPVPMTVVNSHNSCYGAVALLYDEYLEKVAEEMNDDLYIYPSSLHEIICTPASIISAQEGLEMVTCINSTEISEEDYLADTVYFYDRAKHEVSIAIDAA